MEEQVLKLEQAIDKLNFLNTILSSIDIDCKDIVEGIFSYEKYENIDYFKSAQEQSTEIPKSLNFPLLYSSEDVTLKKKLEEYKKLFDENSLLIESIEENYSKAIFYNEHYFEKVFNGIVEINSIVEIEESLGDYICQTLSKLFLEEKVNPSIIDSDYILTVLDNMKEEQIVSYMGLVKNKLKEIQSISPYTESGLEIFKAPKPSQEEIEKSSNYQDAFRNILKNVNNLDD